MRGLYISMTRAASSPVGPGVFRSATTAKISVVALVAASAREAAAAATVAVSVIVVAAYAVAPCLEFS